MTYGEEPVAMKRFQTEYSENRITYWPAYEAGKIGIISLIVLGTLFITTAIWTLFDNPSRETRLETQVTIPIVVFVLCVLLRYTYRTMHIRIVISNTGIEYFKNNVAAEKQIAWENVESVYFSQELWYGRKSCGIFFKRTASQRPSEKDRCDFVLPVHSVDEQKLLQLIPKCLWANNPWYS